MYRSSGGVKSLYNSSTKESKKKRRFNILLNKYRVFRRAHGRQLFYTFLFLFVIIFGGVSFYLFKHTDFLIVKNVEVIGPGTFVNNIDLTSLVKERTKNTYIFKVNSSDLESVLSSTFLGAENIEVSKKLPSTMIVTVKEREPLAVLHNPKDVDKYLVDKSGYVLGLVDADHTNLPQVVYNQPVYVGSFIDPDLVPLYLSLITSLDRSNIKASSISINKRYITFYTDSIEVFLGRYGIEDTIIGLEELLSYLLNEEKRVNKIDLRYDKVVVQYDELQSSEENTENEEI